MVAEPNYCSGINFDNLNDIQVSSSHDVYDTLLSSNNLKRVMRSDNTYTFNDYEYDVVHAALPWIVFAIFAFILLIVAIVLRFLRCMCCRQQIKQRGRLIKVTCVTCSFLITFISLLVCSFLIYYSDQTFQSCQQVQCASGRIPYTMKHGNNPAGWRGLDQISLDSSNISYNLQNVYRKATETLWAGTNSWLSTTALPDLIEMYYTNNSDSKVSCPNPYNLGVDVPVAYIEALGPTNDSSTFSGQIQAEFNVKLLPILSAMTTVKTDTLTILAQLNSSMPLINSTNSSIEKFVYGINYVDDNIHNWVIDNEEQIKSSWRSFTFGIVIWGWFICIGALITVYSQAMNKPFIAHGLCCFWLFTGLIAVVGFLASAGTLAVGLVTRDGCGLIDDLFTSEGVTTYTVIIPKNISSYMDTCLNKGGDIAAELNITKFLDAMLKLSNDYAILANLSVTESLSDFTSIQNNQKNLSLPIDFTKVLPGSIDPSLTPQYNLQFLNELTNNLADSSHQSTCSETASDLWVLNVGSCGDYKYTVSQNPKTNLGSKSCLLITEWNQGQINSRYHNYFDCTYSTSLGDYEDTIKAYLTALDSFASDTLSLFQSLNEELDYINSSITSTVQNMVSLNTQIATYFSTPEGILYLLESSIGKQGLNGGLNCSYLHDYSLSLKQAMCTNTLENTYQVFIFIFVLSFFMLLLEVVNLYLSRALLKGEEVY